MGFEFLIYSRRNIQKKIECRVLSKVGWIRGRRKRITTAIPQNYLLDKLKNEG
jgi:hypothetical protein